MREAIRLGTNEASWLRNGLIRKLLYFPDPLNYGISDLSTANGH